MLHCLPKREVSSILKEMLAWQYVCTNTFMHVFEVFNMLFQDIEGEKKEVLSNRLDSIWWNKDKISLATATLIKINLLDLRSYLPLMYVTLDLLIYQLLVILKKEAVAAVSSSV